MVDQLQEIKKPLTSILVKPAGPDCNLACAYCFYNEKSGLFPETKKHRMSGDILEIFIKQAMNQSGENISFGWQGGEPTLMGLDFFKKAVELQRRHGRNQMVGNGLQTNGILIDSEWAEFLARNKFLVGLSIDGPEHVHDHYRFMKGGQGTWSKVRDRAGLMLDSGVEVNALTVVNDYSARFPEEIYSFHKDIGLVHMQFIPCVETDPDDPTRAAPFSVSAEAQGEFICKLFDLWLDDFVDGIPQTFIRLFDSVFYHYVDMQPPDCTMHKECGIYVVVEHNGDIYSCDFFVEPEWKLGNIRDELLIDLLNSPKQIEFGKIKADLPGECKKCKWLDYCLGGCIKDRIRDPRDKRLDHFCNAHKMFFEHAHPRLEAMAEKWKAEHGTAHTPVIESTRKEKPGRNDPCPCGSGLKYKKCCGK